MQQPLQPADGIADVFTPRLRLAAFTPPAVAASIDGDRAGVARLLRARVPDDWPQPDFAEILPVLSDILAAHPEAVSRTRLIVHAAENTVIGDLGYFWTEAPVWEFGYAVLPGYRGRGYATEAVRGLIAWGFSAYPVLEGVVAECEPDNAASARVLEKAGLRRDGANGALLRWRLDRAERGA